MLKHIVENLPFVGLVVNPSEHPALLARLLEAAIFGGITIFGTTQVLGTKVDGITTQMVQVEQTLINQDTRLRNVEREAAINAQRIKDEAK